MHKPSHRRVSRSRHDLFPGPAERGRPRGDPSPRFRARWWRLALALVALGASVSSPVAITDEEIYRDFRFNFINPGGRSLGMGGAFISIANDATAAQANPACLSNLLSSQLFLEARYGSVDRTLTGTSYSNPPFDAFDITVETDPASTVVPSFVSYVVVPKRSDRFRFAFSRQELLNTDNSTTSTYVFSLPAPGDVRSTEGHVKVNIVSWNGSTSWRIGEAFRVGATLSWVRFDMKATVVNRYVDPTGAIFGDPALAGVPVELYRTTADETDADFSGTLGLQWLPFRGWTLGATYRKGPRFTVNEKLTGQPIDPTITPGLIVANVFLNENDTLPTPGYNSFDMPDSFHVPDVMGIGVSWQPSSDWTLSVDANRIRYTNLMDGFNSRLNLLTSGFATEEDAHFTVRDQTNLHLGIEYRVPGSSDRRRFAVRTGIRRDKSNRIHADFPEQTPGLGSNSTFPPGKDLTHVALGVGLVFRNALQLDLAADVSSETREGVLSFVYRFGS